jgi:hypothetical protein
MSGLKNSVVNALSWAHNRFIITHCVRHMANYYVMGSRRRTKETGYMHVVSNSHPRLQ